jgi:hypothetical protein
MQKRPAPKLPAFLFYPGDWMKDPQLRACSPAARGIWIDLLCAMHENGRTGTVTGTIKELAQFCSCNPREMQYALDELKRLKTAHVTFGIKNVTVANRRMQREHNLREANKLRMRKLRQKQRRDADVAASSSCSSSVSSSKEELVSKKLSSERESSSGEKRGTLSQDFTEEFFDDLQDRKIYRHLDVRDVFERFKVHVEECGGTGNRAHFLGWLNREKGETHGDPTTRTNAKIDKVVQDLVRDRDLNKAQGGSS